MSHSGRHGAAVALTAALCLLACVAYAQPPASGVGTQAAGDGVKKKKTFKPGSAWTLSEPLGVHYPAPIDTLLYNYQRRSIPSMQSDAYATTGNLGAEGIDMIYFDRLPVSDFFFRDAVERWLPSFRKQKFYNVYIPMTLLSYNGGGDRYDSQERVAATFAGNVNRRIGIGGDIDFLYSRGSYEHQAAKNFAFGLSGYYLGDRYEAQAFYNHYNAAIQQNGGITDDLYITDPAELQGGVSKINPKSIPVNLKNALNRIRGDELYFNHAYKLGFHRTEQVNDTLTRKVFVPVTKFIHTLDYQSGTHVFRDRNAQEVQDFWENAYFNADRTDDNTHYWQLSNTIGVAMIEGFHRWVKFGLSAYATYEYRHFRQASDYPRAEAGPDMELTPLPTDYIPSRGHQSLLWVGGQLTKQRGALLRYRADARFGLLGDVLGDIDINGELSTHFRLRGDTASVTAYGFFRNKAQPYLLQKYISNNFVWSNDFNKTQSFRVGGRIDIPWAKCRTTAHAGFETIQNLVYFGTDGKPRQNRGNVRVFTASIEQNFRFGIWNWNNRVTYQTTSDENVLPLPVLSVYSNMFLNFKAFKALEVQVGFDCDYYTRYRGLAFQPATMTFHTQDKQLVGNYPFCNVYLTCKLYKVRFYVMGTHITQGWCGKRYFSVPGYPLNPRRFQLGLSIDFAN